MYSYFASNVPEVAFALNNMDMYEPWQQEFICSEANRYAINFFWPGGSLLDRVTVRQSKFSRLGSPKKTIALN